MAYNQTKMRQYILKKRILHRPKLFTLGLILILQLISLLCISIEYKKSLLCINDTYDIFGNILYPKSAYNSLLGYTNGNSCHCYYIMSFLVITKMIYASIINENKTRTLTEQYFYYFIKFFIINIYVLITNAIITFSIFPAANPEISSFEFPMAYANQYGNELYYNFPVVHVFLSIIIRSLIFSLMVVFPIILFSFNIKFAKTINLSLVIIDVLYFILSILSDNIYYFDFLTPYFNDFFSFIKLCILFCTIMLINSFYYIFSKNNFSHSFNFHLFIKFKKILSHNIAYPIVLFIIFSFFIGRILYLNYNFQNQEVVQVCRNAKFESNHMSISIQDTKVESGNLVYQEYNLKMNKHHISKTTYILLVDLSFSNSHNSKAYFDFSNCYIMIGQWFTNLDLDLFNTINPKMKGNYRLCLKPGSELNVVVPFEICYNPSDTRDYLSRAIKKKKKASLYIGKYPIKNVYDIDFYTSIEK